jgi:hypothetical protein
MPPLDDEQPLDQRRLLPRVGGATVVYRCSPSNSRARWAWSSGTVSS